MHDSSRRARSVMVVAASASLACCTPAVAPDSPAFPTVMPELAACARDSSASLFDGVHPAALVMLGYDFGPQCSGTIVELDDSFAYGFTAEPDFVYVLDRATGVVKQTVPVSAGPDYVVAKESRVFIRTYDTDYVFDAR